MSHRAPDLRGNGTCYIFGSKAFAVSWTKGERVFRLKWTNRIFGLCLGPLMVAFMWGAGDD